MKSYWRSGSIAPRILWPRPSHFTLRQRTPATHWIGSWVGPRAVMDAVVKRKIPSTRRESNPRTPIVQHVAQRYTDWAIAALEMTAEAAWVMSSLICHFIMEIVTRLRAGRQGFDSRQELGVFLFVTASRLALGPTQPPVGSGGYFPGVQWPWHVADHSPPSFDEVMNAWSYTSTLPHVLMTWYLVKHWDNFTFLSYLSRDL
jgi:hypothetical protein